MKGLLIKDFSYFLENVKLYVGASIFFMIVFTFRGLGSIGIMGVLMFNAFVLALNSFSFDEQNNWNKYALTMPLKRSDIVLAKYVYEISAIIGIVVVTYIVSIILNLLNVEIGLELNVLATTSLILGSVAILGISIMYPILFKFGAEKASILAFAIILIPMIIAFVAAKIFPNGIEDVSAFFGGIEPVILGIAYGIVLLVALLFSIKISISIMEKKEF